MSHIAKHIYTLNHKMYRISNLPTAFEYYSAIHLTQLFQKPFHVYQDIPASAKQKFGFPIQDKGVDIVDEGFDHIAQVKYYRNDSVIKYGTLSTFLATPVLVGRKAMKLSLVRTDHSLIHADIQKIVMRGDMTDYKLCQKSFLESIK